MTISALLGVSFARECNARSTRTLTTLWSPLVRITPPKAPSLIRLAGPAPPTLVELIAFSATGYAEGVLLAWQTGYEVDNLGFRLYRDDGHQRRSSSLSCWRARRC